MRGLETRMQVALTIRPKTYDRAIGVGAVFNVKHAAVAMASCPLPRGEEVRSLAIVWIVAFAELETVGTPGRSKAWRRLR